MAPPARKAAIPDKAAIRCQVLKPAARILIKTIQVTCFKEPENSAHQTSRKVLFAQAGASWSRSSELWLLASGFRMV
jgi:hypothetical protein